MKVATLRTLEWISFIAAFAFMIPTIASDSRFPYRVTVALTIGGLLLAVSLFLSCQRAAEHYGTAAIKLIAYFVLVWIAYERVFMH